MLPFYPSISESLSLFCICCMLARNENLFSPWSIFTGTKPETSCVSRSREKKERKREREREREWQCLCWCTFSLCSTSTVWYTKFHLALLRTHTHTHTDIHTHINATHGILQCTGSFKRCMKEWLGGFCSQANRVSGSQAAYPQRNTLYTPHLLSEAQPNILGSSEDAKGVCVVRVRA